MRRFLISVIAVGAILGAGVMPASAATTRAAANESPAATAAVESSPSAAHWAWVWKGLYSTYTICYDVGETFAPFQFTCEKYYIGSRPGDYEWVLYVLELVD